MSTLWTPDGERPIRRDPPSAPPPAPGGSGSSGTSDPPAPPGSGQPPAGPGPEQEELDPETARQVAELTEQMLSAPVEIIIANHAYNLFELAALHLSQQPPNLQSARTAIDAMGALVDGMAGRLGEAERQLTDGVNQLRMAFVEIAKAATGAGGPGDQAGDAGAEG